MSITRMSHQTGYIPGCRGWEKCGVFWGWIGYPE